MRQIFAWVWRKRLIDDFTGQPHRVVRVTGWNKCLYDTPSGQRVRATFLGGPWAGWRCTVAELGKP